MVYQHDINNIYKAIYSRAHRNPSWQEMFTANNNARQGTADLKPEKVDAFELAYIRKFTSNSYLQTNVFYLMNKDQIYNSATDPLYKNVLDTDLYGLELEYSGYLSSSDKVYLNYAYVEGKSHIDSTNTSNLSLNNVAKHLLKAYYIYSINSNLSFSTIGKYVGSKDRMLSDTRDKLSSYSVCDMALKYKNTRYNFDVLFAAKNVFDSKVKYPSTPKTYTSDYLQDGRNFLITLKKEF